MIFYKDIVNRFLNSLGSMLPKHAASVIIITMCSHAFSAPSKDPALENYFPDGYVSGKTFRTELADLVKSEKGFVIKVPADYAHPDGPLIEIYTHIEGNKNFNPDLPTIIWFNGGPGQTSHMIQSGLNPTIANIIQFDQRGIGLSRFESAKMALQPELYSSENTARDALAILDALKVKQATAWGVSYGTVPATLFGHFFPSRAKSVVLSGVVESGFGENEVKKKSHATQKEANLLYQELLPGIRASYQNAIDRGLLEADEIPMILVKHLMQYGRFKDEKVLQPLTYIVRQTSPANYAELIQQWQDSLVPHSANVAEKITAGEKQTIPEFERHLYAILRLKEFEQQDRKITDMLILKNGQIFSAPEQIEPEAEFFPNLVANSKTYRARDYPVAVPVVYLQGTADTATPPLGAVTHFKLAAKGKKQLFLFKKTGHGVITTFNGLNLSSYIQLIQSSILTDGLVSDRTVNQMKQSMHPLEFTLVERPSLNSCMSFFLNF